MSQTFNAEAELIKIQIENMLVQWGQNAPIRTGLHASSVLVSDAEWCVREHVLMEFFSQQAIKPETMPWDWRRNAIFENGWRLHQRWQDVFKKFGNVVSGRELTESGFFSKPELDLTHYDETREVYFSPDAILEFGGQQYVVEIKGIKQEAFHEITITGDLETAMDLNETINNAFYQAQLYMHLLELKKAILLIENKNNQDFRIWIIEYDREATVKYVQRIYDRKEAVILVRTHGLVKLPFRISACQSRGDDRARKCPMREVCFSDATKMEG